MVFLAIQCYVEPGPGHVSKLTDTAVLYIYIYIYIYIYVNWMTAKDYWIQHTSEEGQMH